MCAGEAGVREGVELYVCVCVRGVLCGWVCVFCSDGRVGLLCLFVCVRVGVSVFVGVSGKTGLNQGGGKLIWKARAS